MKDTIKLFGTHSRGLYRPLRALALAAFVLCICAACQGGIIPKPTQATGTISGNAYFKNSDTHAGITVTLEQTDGLRSVVALQTARSIIASGAPFEGDARSISAARSAAAYTQTSADGSYVFSDVAPGIYTVYASSPDSLEKAVAVNNVFLEAGQSLTAVDLNLTPVGSIAGRVLLDGRETGNLGFLVCVSGTSYIAVTGDDGGFVISGVPTGDNYLILIIKGNYTAVWTATPQSVSGGQTTTLIAKTITSAEIGGTGIVWKGESNIPPANPQLNWAYYNTADKTSYIWNGSKWDVLAAQGQQGEPGIGCDCGNGDENRPPEISGMVYVPGGSFEMGKELGTVGWGDMPEGVRTVTLTGFYMGKYLVTQAQYQAVMGTNPSYYSSNPASGETQGNRPVENVSWYDVIEFCNALSVKEGLSPYYSIDKVNKDPNNTNPDSRDPYKWTVTRNASANGYRLPTEAQWEYAAKGGITPGNYTYPGSNDVDAVVWHWYNSNYMTHEVGKKAANSLGIYDMCGNVHEWCWDWRGDYSGGTDPVGPSSGTDRVRRGGGWNHGPNIGRIVDRYDYNPYTRLNDVGFRLVRPLDTGPTITDGVARIGTTQYPTLLAAINAAAQGTIASPTEIVLLKNITAPETNMETATGYIINGKNIKLTVEAGQNQTITAGPGNFTLFTVNSGASFTLKGNGSATLTLDGKNEAEQLDRRGITVRGNLVMEDNAVITGFNNYASFRSFCDVTGDGGGGGGVSVRDGGSFTMLGGAITGNYAPYGGGVWLGGGTFIMKGGKINNNNAWFNSDPSVSNINNGNGGGGVWIGEPGTFTMWDGTIENNLATGGAGGVMVCGVFTMEGGIIQNNSAYEGGGVGIGPIQTKDFPAIKPGFGIFNMKGGAINGNKAFLSGGGIAITPTIATGGAFYFSGGIVYGSNAGTGLTNSGGSFSIHASDSIAQYVAPHPKAGQNIITTNNTIE